VGTHALQHAKRETSIWPQQGCGAAFAHECKLPLCLASSSFLHLADSAPRPRWAVLLGGRLPLVALMRSSTAALLLLAAWSGASWATDNDPGPDSDSLCQRSRASGQPVIVVGTGFSGIAAALALQEHNCTALLLEARDRVGGRTHSLEGGVFDGQDEGAHWVEGNSPKRNPIKKMIVEHGLAYTRVSRHPVGGTEANFHEVAIYDEQGRRFSIAEKRQAFLFFG